MEIFEKLRLANKIQMRDGEISLMGTPVNILPTSLLVTIQKGLIKEIGFKKAYSLIYEQAKAGSYQYNMEFIKSQKYTDQRVVIQRQIEIVTSAGWGKLQIIKNDFANKQIEIKYDNSTFAREYKKASYPVCLMPAGFTAGGVSANVKSDLDALETKCLALGDPYCKIEIGPEPYIEGKQTMLWSSLKID